MSFPKDTFKDLIVVELATVLAGPAVGMFFAELGARVIKVESKTGGDVTRSWKLTSENPEARESAYFHSVNYKKQHLFLDLTNLSELQDLYALVAEADIVISNFKTSSAERLAIDYASLKQYKEDIIYAELIAFDAESKKIGYDAVMQAEAGFLSMSGTVEGELVKMPVALIDLMAAHQLKEAILIAMLKKAQTGKGAHILVSLIESGIASLANQASNYLNAGHIAKPMGTLHPNIAPYGELFHLKDGNSIILSVGSDVQFTRLVFSLGIPDDPKFAKNQDRLKNRAQLFQILSSHIAKHSLEEIQVLFESNSVPYGHVKSIHQVMDYARAKGLILTNRSRDNVIERVRTAVFKFIS